MTSQQRAVVDYMDGYRSAAGKQKKRFMRKPNQGEARDEYKQLALKTQQEKTYSHSSFFTLAAARCEESMDNVAAQAEQLVSAGQNFFKAEASKMLIKSYTFEDDLIDAVQSYDTAIELYLKLKRFSFAASLCMDVARFLAALGRDEDAIPYSLKAAGFENMSSLSVMHSLLITAQYQANIMRFEDAAVSLFRIVDIVLDTCGCLHIDDAFQEKRAPSTPRGSTSSQSGENALPNDLDSKLVDKDTFLAAVRLSVPGAYREILEDVEIRCLLLLHLLPSHVVERFRGLGALKRRYLDDHDSSQTAVHVAASKYFLLQSLVLALDEEDHDTIRSLQGELWPFFTVHQNELLQHITRNIVN